MPTGGGGRRRGLGGAAGAFPGPSGGSPQRRTGQNIYILDENQKPKAVFVRTGITDGRYTQIVSGDLKEGDRH